MWLVLTEPTAGREAAMETSLVGGVGVGAVCDRRIADVKRHSDSGAGVRDIELDEVAIFMRSPAEEPDSGTWAMSRCESSARCRRVDTAL